MTTAPYDPRSGNTPDAKPLNMTGKRYQAQAPKVQTPYDPLSGNTPDFQAPTEPKTVFLPVATIITQGGQEVDVDASGRAEDGSVPIGTTKGLPVEDEVVDLNPDKGKKKSAYDLLYEELNPLGLGSLVDIVLKPLIEDPGVSEDEFTTSLRKSEQYKKRFAANEKRVLNGFKPLSESAYLALEDQYQNVMRNYGLPESYYAKGEFGRQEGFEKLIANNIANTELEERIMTAQQRVINANPEVVRALKQFYTDITNGDILSYALDPANAKENIKRKVTAAEIGGAAFAAGLNLGTTPEQIAASKSRAEMLQGYGVTKEAATSGFQTVADATRGGQLAAFYNRPTYGQMEAEQEVFKLEGATAARKKRSEITGLEKATFGGQTGLTGGALARDRAGGY